MSRKFAFTTAVLLATLYEPEVAVAQAHPSPEERVLYEKGKQQLDTEHFEKARLTLQTLLNAYPSTPLNQQAKSAIRESWIRQGVADPDAMLLCQQGQTFAKVGKTEAALLTFQTLLNLYPTSEYAAKAKRFVHALTDREN